MPSAPSMNPADIFSFMKVFEKVPFVGKLFQAGPNGVSAFQGWLVGLSHMSTLEWMGVLGAGAAVLSIAAYSEIFFRQVFPVWMSRRRR